jgi:hypothetical protein
MASVNVIVCKRTGAPLANKLGGGTCACTSTDECALELVTDGQHAEVRVVDAIAAPALRETDPDLILAMQHMFKDSGLPLKVILGSLSQLAAMCIMQGQSPESREIARNSHFVTVVAYMDQYQDVVDAARPPGSKDN